MISNSMFTLYIVISIIQIISLIIALFAQKKAIKIAQIIMIWWFLLEMVLIAILTTVEKVTTLP